MSNFENRALVGYYAASSGCPETSARNFCHYSLRNDPEERGSQLLRRRKPEFTRCPISVYKKLVKNHHFAFAVVYWCHFELEIFQ